jgi:hypothetical protein
MDNNALWTRKKEWRKERKKKRKTNIAGQFMSWILVISACRCNKTQC